jgi:hypothetical protein
MPEPSRAAEMSAQLGWPAPMTEKEAERGTTAGTDESRTFNIHFIS